MLVHVFLKTWIFNEDPGQCKFQTQKTKVHWLTKVHKRQKTKANSTGFLLANHPMEHLLSHGKWLALHSPLQAQASLASTSRHVHLGARWDRT